MLSTEEPTAEAIKTFEKIKERFLSGTYKPAERIFDRDGNKVFDMDEQITPDKADAIALILTEKIVQDRLYMIQAKKLRKHMLIKD